MSKKISKPIKNKKVNKKSKHVVPVVKLKEKDVPKDIPIENLNDSSTKKPRKKKGQSVEKMYFTKETEDAIIRFNKETDEVKRNKIYEEFIQKPFEKLVENVFNTFKFSYFEVGPLEVQKETLSHLLSNIHKFEEGKGKAFSYFSIVAKHYLIFHNNTNYKRFSQHVDINEENGENTVKLQTFDSHGQKEAVEFINMMVKYWDNNIKSVFPKQKDLKIAEAVVELFRNSDRLEFFNKKALYLYIREISSCKTQQITRVINKMKDYHEKLTRQYIKSGIIESE